MKRRAIATSLVLLAACSSGSGENPLQSGEECIRDNPLQACEDSGSGGSGGGSGGGSSASGNVPDDLAGTLAKFSFASDMDSVTVTINGLDSGSADAVYARNDALTSALGLDGYVAYSLQEDPLDRFFMALGAASEDGSVAAAAVGSGGQFDAQYQGGIYARDGSYDPPGAGEDQLVTYAGDYAALTNLGTRDGAELLDPGTLPDDYDEFDLPGQPAMIRGVIFLNVSFVDNEVNGQIFNRDIIDPRDTDVSQRLNPVTLELSEIDSNGEFFGAASNAAGSSPTITGSYGGIFGGTDAAYVAGLTNLSWDAEGVLGASGGTAEEVGMFVLTQCGKPGSVAALCP
ncbi:hypothetical protein [Salipiger mangrovisoli]|uniref:Transferrin-binding protein B C-lobe/N-lobe beta barrel domain-containing protein n=1 Tax=Salipiger mangrovisoli TaxID=2865933 RepID=A0ABR9X7A0_9RHOB|nr:hypothetical protein [Salipiger mangrovisoli]MBE9639374.1 hypothetical protein [Salipiger mangrovisoli]